MRPSRRVTLTTAGLLFACLAGSVLLLRRVDEVRTGATLREVLYVSSPKAVKRLSLGYTGLMADIYWTRAVQYFGGQHHQGGENYALLGPLLEITTTLDPQLLVAYEYGSNFLAPPPPNGAGDPQAAVDLVKYGIRHNPNEWRLYYNLGFIYYMEMSDYAAAADAFAKGSKLPKAHPFLPVMAASMATHAGDLAMARMMWRTTYDSALVDSSVKANALVHLRALQVDEDVTLLEGAVSEFRKKTGTLPQNLAQLGAEGLLRGLRVQDPFGDPYKIMPDGRVEVSRPDDFPFIKKGTPPGYIAPPPKFLHTD